ncbi:MAG: GAF domain-containing protein [Roseomonas mucosa]|nr:GAF domain-containing protein [Roseomonas mucosa]
MTRPPPSLPLPDLHALPGRPDTSTCDREPIHVPASIQPHGLLLVLDPDTLRVLQAAGDMQHLLGIPLDAALGEEAGRFLPSDAIQALCTPAPAPQEPGPPRLPTGARLLSGVELRPGRFFDLQGRDSPAGIIVEIEPRGVPGPVRQDDTLILVQGMIASLQGAATARPYCEAAAATIRDMTGFDRVMVYRFEPDDTGCVVAEARAEGTGSYLGLHFPASDIPKQARALYLRNWMRLIPDAHYIPEPLIPALSPRTGEALDMSDCSLRAVSPIHLQYLRNMGVQASMSLSIQQGGRLWGLIACHHRTAWHLPVALRAACEIFAQMFSLQLETLEQREDHEDALRMRRVHEHLEQVMAQEEELGEGLIRQRPNLLDYLEAGGVAVMASGRYATAGQTPTREQVNGLVEWLRGTVEERIVALDRLPELYPPSREFADVASGVLALSVSRAPQDYILWSAQPAGSGAAPDRGCLRGARARPGAAGPADGGAGPPGEEHPGQYPGPGAPHQERRRQPGRLRPRLRPAHPRHGGGAQPADQHALGGGGPAGPGGGGASSLSQRQRAARHRAGDECREIRRAVGAGGTGRRHLEHGWRAHHPALGGKRRPAGAAATPPRLRLDRGGTRPFL